MMDRRSILAGGLSVPVAGALAASIAIPAAKATASPLRADAALTDADPWLRLCAERRMLHEFAESSVTEGDIPEAIEDVCWPRVVAIDAEIAASQPTTVHGLRAALVEYLIELEGCSICDQDLLRSLLGAALSFTERNPS